jgi:hypothetical protein
MSPSRRSCNGTPSTNLYPDRRHDRLLRAVAASIPNSYLGDCPGRVALPHLQQPCRRPPSLRFAGDKWIVTLQWSLGIIDRELPAVPPAEAKALDDLEARFNSQGLDGVPSPDIERDLHGKWPHSLSAQYQDPEAVKVEHATYEFGALERFEIALTEFLLTDEQRKTPLLSPSARNDTLSRSSGYVALLGSYAACKLNGVMSGQKTSTVAH